MLGLKNQICPPHRFLYYKVFQPQNLNLQIRVDVSSLLFFTIYTDILVIRQGWDTAQQYETFGCYSATILDYKNMRQLNII